MLPILLANQINVCISDSSISIQLHVNSSLFTHSANSKKDQNTVCWLVNFNLANMYQNADWLISCWLVIHSLYAAKPYN